MMSFFERPWAATTNLDLGTLPQSKRNRYVTGQYGGTKLPAELHGCTLRRRLLKSHRCEDVSELKRLAPMPPRGLCPSSPSVSTSSETDLAPESMS
jgi:hypothetical protein